MLGGLWWTFKSIWWNHQMCLPDSALGGECLFRGLGVYSSRGLHTAGIQYKFICIKHSDRGVWRNLHQAYVHNASRLPENRRCLSESCEMPILYVGSIHHFKKRERWDEKSTMVYCKVVLVFEKFAWIVHFSHDLMLSVTRCLTSHWILVLNAACCQKISTFVNV